MIPVFALGIAAYQKPGMFASLVPAMARPADRAGQSAAAEFGQDVHVTIINNEDAKDQIVGSGNPAAKTWDLADFNRVQINSTFRAEITKGTAFKVTTTADDNVLPHIRVVKEGTTLKIALASGSYRLKNRLKAEITLPTLIGLDISGASRGTLKGFQSEKELKVKVSGSSGLEGSIGLETAEFAVDGASTLSLTGSAQAARLSAHGSSQLKLGDFLLKQCQIKLEGASSAEIMVKSEEPFNANVWGSSTLKGSLQTPKVGLSLAGASRATLEGKATDANDPRRRFEQPQAAGPGPSECRHQALGCFPRDGERHRQTHVRGQFRFELEIPGRSQDT